MNNPFSTRVRHTLAALWISVAALATGCDPGPAEHSEGASDPSGKADDASDVFFAEDSFYYIRIRDWPRDRMSPGSLGEALTVPGAKFEVFEADPDHERHCPDDAASPDNRVGRVDGDFSVQTLGKATAGTPKASYMIRLLGGKIADMDTFILKSSWNDVSQMREALSYGLMQWSGVRAPRQTYARVCLNDKYLGLYSVIEAVDDDFLEHHFGENDEGNLYEGGYSKDDIGPANLTYRSEEATGNDRGDAYYKAESFKRRTYRLSTNTGAEEPAGEKTYDDLAALVRVINAADLPGGDERFDTEAYRESVEDIFDVHGFLRFAAMNMLIGGWDNYWGQAGNYFLYNSGKLGGADEFVEEPYFHFIPFDYDNCLGIDYFRVAWEDADILNWREPTRGFNKGRETKLPLITNLLQNKDFLRYYMDVMTMFLDSRINRKWFESRIGLDGSGGLWDQVRESSYLESDSPTGAPHTGRQFTNEQIYYHAFEQYELPDRHSSNLQWGDRFTLGIVNFVRKRHSSAREDLRALRDAHPEGSSGAEWLGGYSPLPEYEDDTIAPDPVRVGDVEFRWYQSPGDALPDFDARRDKIALFVHGWHEKNRNQRVAIDFSFGLVVDGGAPDLAKQLQEQGWNVAVIDWFDAAHTDRVLEAERTLWRDDFRRQVTRAYVEGMRPILERALVTGRQPEIRIMGHSIGAQAVAALMLEVGIGESSELGWESAVDEPASRILWPNRVTLLDPYFSSDQNCWFQDASDNGCHPGPLGFNRFRPAALTHEFAVAAQRVFDDAPPGWFDGRRFGLETYSTIHNLSELFGEENRPLLADSAYVELDASSQGVEVTGFDFLWDWQGRRHAYPLYWYFKTWAEGYEPPDGGVSAASDLGAVRTAMSGEYIIIQTEGAEDTDVRNDRFERRSF